MVFVQSLGGISHNRLEDSRREHIELGVAALDRLVRTDCGDGADKYVGGFIRSSQHDGWFVLSDRRSDGEGQAVSVVDA